MPDSYLGWEAAEQALTGSFDCVEASLSQRPVITFSWLEALIVASGLPLGITVARADLLPTISVFAQTGYQAFPTLNRLPFKPDFSTLPLKLARAQIKLENPESDPTRGWYHWFHCI